MLCFIDDLLMKKQLAGEQEMDLKKKVRKLMEYNHPESVKIDSMEFMNCRITLTLMKDPVLDNEGHTYEKESLMKHMSMNGNFDPTTRKPILDTVPNHAIKKAISANYEEYITEEDSITDYHDLHFN